MTVVFIWRLFSLIIRGDNHFHYEDKAQIQSSSLIKLSPSLIATLRNKRNLAAVSRETPEGTRSSRAQNALDPELTQDYFSEVSEGIEERVTKKLSKEFSRTESRILGSLSELDEFLLNPQVRTCSVAVPGTSRNNDSGNRETTGDRSSDDPCRVVGYLSHHSGHRNSPEAENYPHINQITVNRIVILKQLEDGTLRKTPKKRNPTQGSTGTFPQQLTKKFWYNFLLNFL